MYRLTSPLQPPRKGIFFGRGCTAPFDKESLSCFLLLLTLERHKWKPSSYFSSRTLFKSGAGIRFKLSQGLSSLPARGEILNTTQGDGPEEMAALLSGAGGRATERGQSLLSQDIHQGDGRKVSDLWRFPSPNWAGATVLTAQDVLEK